MRTLNNRNEYEVNAQTGKIKSFDFSGFQIFIVKPQYICTQKRCDN